jgi:hypothetical protein
VVEMENEREIRDKELEEIDRLIHKVWNSALEFRNAIREIIFIRLHRFFGKMNKEIKTDTDLKLLFKGDVTELEWEELKEIGLRIPGLERAKVFERISVVYGIAALIALMILAVKNLELLFVLWGLPIFGLFLLALSPLVLLMMLFKRRHLPCDNVDQLIEMIISLNWTDLLTDDKRLFKMLIRQEEEWKKRASALYILALVVVII